MSDGLQIFDGSADAGPGGGDAGDTTPHPDETHAKRRPRWLGGLAGGVAILMVLTWAIGLVALTNGMFELGVGLSISAVLLSGIAVIGGTACSSEGVRVRKRFEGDATRPPVVR